MSTEVSIPTKSPGAFSALKGRWQIPMLAIGMAAFGLGIVRLILSYQTVTFEQHCERIDTLVAGGAMTRAHAYVLYLLKDPELPAAERGEFHRRLVGITYRVDAPQRKHSAENRLGIISNFKRAVELGATPTGFDWFALANAYEWSDRVRDAVSAYRQSLMSEVDRPDRVRRRLIELAMSPGKAMPVESVADLDGILSDGAASPANYLWAMETKANWLLDSGRIDDAATLVAEGRKRLAGTSEAPAVSYSEALCLKARGDSEGATATLIGLQNEWPARDTLWGRSMWLLGQIHQEDDRPQAAMALYDDVLSSFVEGALHDACSFARAECLLSLERHEQALNVLGELAADAREGRSTNLDTDRIRDVLATTGESLYRAGRDAVAIRFLELASTLFDEDAIQERAEMTSRMADAYVRLAQTDANESDGGPVPAYVRRAAELHAEAATIWASNTPFAVRELRLAADAFDSGGMTEAMIETLDRLVREHPTDLGRPDAMLRLGRAYQATDRHQRAVETFDSLIESYPRWNASLSAVNPLANSLLRLGGDYASRGERVLTDVVEDNGPEPLFTPDAAEYREALFQLAEYLAKTPTPVDAAQSREAQARLAKAIARLNDAIEMYGEDGERPRLEFLRAESLRRTARLIRDDETAIAEQAAQEEVRRRLEAALAGYQFVRVALAGEDEPDLSELDRTYLRAAYVYIGDCLFDLERFEEAAEAYREAAWRYEDDPIAVAASMQVVHCFHRLGEFDESRAALGRMRWLVEKIPAESFDERSGMSPKAYWLTLLDRIERTGV